MPYKDKTKQLGYQRQWMAARRQAWFEGKACAYCETANDLEIHHINPSDKLSHNVWSWADVKRDAELSKCIVLCHACHKVETINYLREASKRPLIHGFSGYKRNCRCEECKSAYAIKRREKYLRRGT